MPAKKQTAPQKRKIKKVMHEFKEGKLRSGAGKHPKVKSRKQAIAIAMSEADVPPKKGSQRANAAKSKTTRRTPGRPATSARASVAARKRAGASGRVGSKKTTAARKPGRKPTRKSAKR